MADAKKKTVERWVCNQCGGIYFVPINERCPGCKGDGAILKVYVNDDGSVNASER